MSHDVIAELAANVWKIVAQPGDKIGPDDTLVILESMKMEIPVLAEVSGTITSFGVAEGDVINEGTVIATVDTD
jgi:acetyl-CoA carboxylase biotin carboxyl carrier protein